MKRLLTLTLSVLLILTACTGCGRQTDDSKKEAETEIPAPTKEQDVELSLWTYPVGNLGNESTLSSLIGAFHRAYPHIHVSIHTVNYETGDAEIEEAISQGKAPDLVFEGPERLSANWGVRGLMVDLGDLWESDQAGEIYPSIVAACLNNDGSHYIYPLCMTTHCMAVNRNLFEAAGAWQYIDEKTHTWTTDGFMNAIKALQDYGIKNIASVYCGGQGGDQGTRALITNLYSGTFTNPEHTSYTFNSPENIKALELLADTEGIDFDPALVGADEIAKFCSGELAMCFCWNVANEISQTISNPNLNFDIFPVTFPTNDGQFNLQGGIWGFGIFDSKDEARINAAKTFIRFMTEEDTQYTQAVLSSSFWPVRDIPNIYENDELMTEYFTFTQYLGDYYQVTPGWTDARAAWWHMLQEIGAGEDIAGAAAKFEDTANAAAGAE